MLRRSRYHLWGSPAVQAAVVLALFMTFLHAGVKAASIGTDFDLTFNANGAVNTSVSYSVNGITVDITPYYSSDPGGTLFPSWSLANDLGQGVTHTENGLGVRSTHANKQKMLNGRTPMEALRLRFSDTNTADALAVTLNAIAFSGVNASGVDDFNLTSNPFSGPVNLLMDETLTGNGWFILAAAATGADFLIWADDVNDNFRITGLDVTAVPLPPAAWLFGAGLLALLGVLGRRRTAPAAG